MSRARCGKRGRGTRLTTRDGSSSGRSLSPMLVSLVVHHWSGSQLSPMVGCWRGSLPVLSMTSVVGALVSHLLYHTQPWGKRGDDVSVTGVRRPGRIHILASWGRQWNLLLGTSYRRWVRVARNCTSRGSPCFRDPVPCTLTRVRCTGTQSLRVGDSFGGPLSK